MISRLSSILLALVASLALGSSVRGQCSGDLNSDGRVDSVDLATLLAQWGTCPATITSVSPAQGSVLGGTAITITGTGLASTTAVTIGGVPCTGVTILSGTQVRATTPAGSAGETAIAVVTPSGTSLAPTPFTYVMQSVASIEPASGIYSGGTPITINGQYLAGTTGVTIGGVPATNVVAVNSTTVTAVTPAGSVGAVDVIVTGAKGTVSVPGGFTYVSIVVPAWATLIEATPDPAVVTNAELRAAIMATGYAWRVRHSQTQIEMLLIPPGEFQMGCSASSQAQCSASEYPVHAVTLTNAFYLGRYEVTQAQWTPVMWSAPSAFAYPTPEVPAVQVPQRPVEMVSWNMVQSFSMTTGLRLPTEAEWEYAYRAGTTSAYHSGPGFPDGTSDPDLLENIAWFYSSAAGQTRPVGQLQANRFGLHDMSGNVLEWVNDWYLASYYQLSPPTNPPGPPTGTNRVLRGGAWNSNSFYSRSSSRITRTPDSVDNYYGFRVARNP